MSYVVCRKCSHKINVPFCHCDSPIHFVATCSKCGYRGVYSYADIVDAEECKELCNYVYVLREKLMKLHTTILIYTSTETLIQQLKRLIQ
jgi:DNA-directed RNA polymerase